MEIINMKILHIAHKEDKHDNNGSFYIVLFYVQYILKAHFYPLFSIYTLSRSPHWSIQSQYLQIIHAQGTVIHNSSFATQPYKVQNCSLSTGLKFTKLLTSSFIKFSSSFPHDNLRYKISFLFLAYFYCFHLCIV